MDVAGGRDLRALFSTNDRSVQAAEAFTNRSSQWETVAAALTEHLQHVGAPGFDPEDLEAPRNHVLVFHGVGGIGKTPCPGRWRQRSPTPDAAPPSGAHRTGRPTGSCPYGSTSPARPHRLRADRPDDPSRPRSSLFRLGGTSLPQDGALVLQAAHRGEPGEEADAHRTQFRTLLCLLGEPVAAGGGPLLQAEADQDPQHADDAGDGG
ncbi:hypothetical protein ACFYR1_48110 [Streptomyces canus]|uniref:hypothetical protein n=1 Tax=Streptomyces canus TaxID=58343 RepID=UPI0036BC5170